MRLTPSFNISMGGCNLTTFDMLDSQMKACIGFYVGLSCQTSCLPHNMTSMRLFSKETCAQAVADCAAYPGIGCPWGQGNSFFNSLMDENCEGREDPPALPVVIVNESLVPVNFEGVAPGIDAFSAINISNINVTEYANICIFPDNYKIATCTLVSSIY